MKGYPVNEGFMGLINGKYYLFATEQDYIEAYNASFGIETN